MDLIKRLEKRAREVDAEVQRSLHRDEYVLQGADDRELLLEAAKALREADALIAESAAFVGSLIR